MHIFYVLSRFEIWNIKVELNSIQSLKIKKNSQFKSRIRQFKFQYDMAVLIAITIMKILQKKNSKIAVANFLGPFCYVGVIDFIMA